MTKNLRKSRVSDGERTRQTPGQTKVILGAIAIALMAMSKINPIPRDQGIDAEADLTHDQSAIA